MTPSAHVLSAPLPVAVASDYLDNPKPTSFLINARTVWISDIHLGFRDCKADYLLDFLNHLRCDTLYLVGDIVDLWSLKRRFCWPQKHYQVMLKFYELAAKGVRVIYVPGNHDDPIRHFSGQLFGPIQIAQEHEYVTADGKRLLIMHGDAMDAYINHSWLKRVMGDHGYELLLFINRWTDRVRKLVGPPLFLARGANQKQYQRRQNRDCDLRERSFGRSPTARLRRRGLRPYPLSGPARGKGFALRKLRRLDRKLYRTGGGSPRHHAPVAPQRQNTLAGIADRTECLSSPGNQSQGMMAKVKLPTPASPPLP
jgi:UDP-2,3-diacylglucosamine pyrophosphatase LpxH